jgi:hypothetical protein
MAIRVVDINEPVVVVKAAAVVANTSPVVANAPSVVVANKKRSGDPQGSGRSASIPARSHVQAPRREASSR